MFKSFVKQRFTFKDLILLRRKVLTVIINVCMKPEKSSSLSVKITPHFLINSMQIQDVTLLSTSEDAPSKESRPLQ